MANSMMQNQTAEKSILDLNGKQTYLGNSFAASTDLVALTAMAGETPLAYLLNPSSNGAPTSIGLFLNSRKLFCASASAIATFRYYSQPTTISGGSVVTPKNLRPANINASVMSFKKSVSAGGNGSLIYTASCLVGAIDPALMVLDPGQAILVTAAVSTDASVSAELLWYEI